MIVTDIRSVVTTWFHFSNCKNRNVKATTIDKSSRLYIPVIVSTHKNSNMGVAAISVSDSFYVFVFTFNLAKL